MAEDIAVAPAPAAAPAAKAPALPSAPKVEINASRIGEGAEPAPPPKPGSARARMADELRKKAGQEPGTERPAKLKEANENEEAAVAPAAVEKDEAAEPAADAGKAPAGDKAPEDPKKGKVSPWKLVEEYKARLARAESEKLEVEKRAIPEDKWKQTNETLAAKEKRLAELEEEIRYVNYSKSDEFKTKYQVPYQKAWDRAMGELGELTVETADGSARALEPNDILELVNLPLGKAHELATEKFGDLAPEVMAHRKEIRKLFDEQASALEDARKSGAEREKLNAETRQKQFGETSTHIKSTWSKANDEIKADPKYGKFFTPVEGDENVNQRLAKGFELADRAFSENPMNAKTAEEREAIVKRHAAVRNRCAAFGRLVYESGVKDSRIAELEKLVKEYKGGEPETRGTTGAEKPPVAAKSTMAGVLEELRKKAKRD